MLRGQGILQGTPAFMAPELVFGESRDRRPGRSLLAGVHRLLGAHRAAPLQAKTPAQMLLHHARSTPLPPSQVSELPIPGSSTRSS